MVCCVWVCVRGVGVCEGCGGVCGRGGSGWGWGLCVYDLFLFCFLSKYSNMETIPNKDFILHIS